MQSSSNAESHAHSHLAMDNSTETRYSKDELLGIAKAQLDSSAASRNVSSLLMDDWDPGHTNTTNGRGWGKSIEARESQGKYVCWDTDGSQRPISFEEMSAEEKAVCHLSSSLQSFSTDYWQLFAGDVNSPLKPPPQNQNKVANGPTSINGRKISFSQGSNSFGLASPGSSRPSTRRRETSESSPFSGGLTSPSGTGRFSRDEQSPYFARRANETKDNPEEREENKHNLHLGGLMRSNTAGSALGGSPWGVTSPTAAISPMGNFGSFGMGGSIPPTPIDKRTPFSTTRGESRLAHLMPKETSEDAPSTAASWRSRPRTDTDPFGDDISGSASMGAREPADSGRRTQVPDTPVRGFGGDMGMSDGPRFRDLQQSHQTPKARHSQEPLSPSDTNPYRSPPDERGESQDAGDVGYEGEAVQPDRKQGLGGMSEQGSSSFGSLNRGLPNAPFDGSDRSQTSSVGGSRGLQAIGGLPSLNMGSLSGWPTSANPIATPDRENRSGLPGAFGNSIFGSMGDLQSPSLSGAGGIFGPGQSSLAGGNTTSRSKLGSLFPAAMQAQMQQPEPDNSGDGGDARQNTLGAIGRNASFSAREAVSPMRSSRHAFEDLFPSSDVARNQAPFSPSEATQGQNIAAFSGPTPSQPQQHSQASSDSASNQLPTAQQRTMVMPDRMAWVYLDPQGQVQGPWSGLEMHDWYKASFFTADLAVKKLEDTEFEPLGQLIRRIGNSREPFLVPQIGIPYGPATSQAGGSFTPTSTANPPLGAVQPPFAGAFPSFGTTLTAEQQNNLERRKQEEQYLMARQREFLAQQQVNMRQMQGPPGSLHHHSSAHSLHSQPSYGSITSPIGMPPQGLPGVQGFPAPQTMGSMTADVLREEDMTRLSLQTGNGPGQGAHAQHMNAMFPQQHDIQRDTAQAEQTRHSDPMGFKAKLQEFEQLRAQHDQEETAEANMNDPVTQSSSDQAFRDLVNRQSTEEQAATMQKPLSLTQQVQRAASAKQIPATQPDSPWNKVNTRLPMPFPPPQSTTPLPAPTAQRGRSNLPETLNAESRSRSESPGPAAAPTLAPWAKESAEASKGPSLKEIQEAEAKKAAKAEEVAAAQRRALQEQELKMLANQPVAPAPGIPPSSTWANTTSPAASSTSAWTKPTPVKAQTISNVASKKTLADIQREEELRKQKVAAAALTAQPASTPGGKRYADLANKPSTSTSTSGSAWSTVGAGGKVKIPTGPATATPATPYRAVSNPSAAAPARPVRPAPATRPSASTGPAGANAANEEFTKWAKGALAKGLNSDINGMWTINFKCHILIYAVDDFVLQLAAFPLEASIIADSVYANSQLMDGRRFAEEFIRRRKLADKGQVEPPNIVSGSAFSTAGDKSGSGGWSEVAKKGPPKEDPTAGFKVVPNKKKGKK